MIQLAALPEATFVNYLFINISKAALFKYMMGYTKMFAVLMVIGDLFLKYFNLIGVNKTVFVAKDFIRPIVFVSIIMTYDIAMSGVDLIVTSSDLYIANTIGSQDQFKSTLPNIPVNPNSNSGTYTPPAPLPDPSSSQSIAGKTFETLSEISSYIIHPTKIITVLLQVIGDFFASLIYTSALLVRAFGLFFLKTIGAVVIGLSIFEKFKNGIWQWLRYYIIFTIWILPFYLVNIFFTYLYAQSRTLCTYGGWGDATYAVSISIIAIFVKFTVTKGSFTWLEKLITIGA